jgi:hypothetical protein
MPTLLTFLGAIPYEATRYYFEGQRDAASEPTPYVQEAILQHLNQHNERIDRVLVFATEDAQANNYSRRIERYDREKKEPVYGNEPGLEGRLERLKQEDAVGDYICVTIPNGDTEQEILDVFQTLYREVSALPEDSDIVFDLTYGFRSLPMLCMLLLHYARTLHPQLRISHIYYGNYEAGRHEKLEYINRLRQEGKPAEIIKEAEDQLTQSPVLELRVFAELQEWVSAAQMFLQAGDASLLAKRMRGEEHNLGEALRTFSDQILTCRGYTLSTREDISKIKEAVRALQQKPDLGAPLEPILERVIKKLEPFADSTTRNGFAAVEWCIEHNLIQQGLTLLEETCKSFLIEQTLGPDCVYNKDSRYCAQTALNRISPLKRKTDQVEKIKRLSDFLQEHYPKASEAYRQLTGDKGLRNDINHGGCVNEPKSPEALRSSLKEVYQRLKEAFKL